MTNKTPSIIQTIAIDKPKNQVIFVDQTAEDKNIGVVTSVLRGEKGDPGVGLQYEWVGSKLGIKTEAESDFEYVDLVAASGDTAYIHQQTSASQEWQVSHNLGKHPSVTVVDSAGTVVVGDITYLDTEELIIRFTSEFSGKAFLN